MTNIKGTCACGQCRFSVLSSPIGVSVCHCSQCRKQSGYAWSSAYVPENDLMIEGPVKWIYLSDCARRGICENCGSFLFWQGKGEDTISFALGALDGPTGLRLEKHIFVADKGDYYEIADGLPQTQN